MRQNEVALLLDPKPYFKEARHALVVKIRAVADVTRNAKKNVNSLDTATRFINMRTRSDTVIERDRASY